MTDSDNICDAPSVVFEKARKLEGSDRQAYLDRACQGDPSLRANIESMIDAHANQGEFLADPTVDVQSGELASIGSMIGPYKLLQKIGEGGMGVVYMAEQREPVERRVALKIIKLGMDTKQVVARFEAERQALAMMDHPNIAKVLDGGSTETGRPYFVMELVKGVPISQYCDEHHLSPRERLELFIPACHALQHAHQKGVIHRDIKPSNVLVAEYDNQRVPKIIDFGVAKAVNQKLTDKTMFTQLGQIVGTLEYMSPEQAKVNQLDVDTRSDIYSLGVLLYELLTGATPFDRKRLYTVALDEMMRILREEDPPKPSVRLSTIDTLARVAHDRRTEPKKLSVLLRGELDWIVMKALDKERSRRYDSASALADDVRRHLNDEPVLARPDSQTYRMMKFARRNKVAIATTALLACCLLLATIVSTYFALKADRERDKAETLESEARRERDKARSLELEARREKDNAQETLRRLQQELLYTATVHAFSLDPDEVERALKKAEEAGAPQDLIATIRGIVHICAGDPDAALEILGKTLKETPDSLAAVCASSLANMHASNYEAGSRLYARIGELAQRQEIDEHSQLLLALALVHATDDLPGLIADLDSLIHQHSRWGIAYAFRAQAKYQLVIETREYVLAESAIDDAAMANRLMPDSPFVIGFTLQVYAAVIELARQSQEDTSQLEREAMELAEKLTDWPDYLQGRHHRANYFQVVGNAPRKQSERDYLVRNGWADPQPEVAELLRVPKLVELKRLAERLGSDPGPRIALAICEILDGWPQNALETHQQLETETERTSWGMMLIDIPALAQRPDLARDAAQRWLDRLSKLDPVHYWRFEVECMRYWAKGLSDSYLLELAGPFHIERSVAHYYVGMRALSRGVGDDARCHLEKTAELGPIGWWYTEFARTYVHLIDQGRLPLRPAKGQ